MLARSFAANEPAVSPTGRHRTRRSALNAAGVEVREAGSGWEELRAPEGYHFAMPGLPQMQESFSFRGVDVPQRFFDLSEAVLGPPAGNDVFFASAGVALVTRPSRHS